MTYKFTLPMFPGANFQMEISNLTGKLKLFKDDILLEQSKENGKPFLIPGDNKKMIEAYPKTYLFFHTLEISGKKYTISRKLTWYEYSIGFLPLLLGPIGGGFAGSPTKVPVVMIICFLGAYFNFFILSREEKNLNKYLKIIGVIGGCFLLYYTYVFLL
jgi:hypothetical protein